MHSRLHSRLVTSSVYRLKPYCKVDEVRVLMKVERCPADQPRLINVLYMIAMPDD